MAKTVRLHLHVREPLKELAKAVRRDYGVPANQQSVVAALIHETTPGQAAGMLMAYTKYLSSIGADEEEEEEDEEDENGAA
jgi:adenosylmethionine-8-amino-7-oxononanoate aminotransferase